MKSAKKPMTMETAPADRLRDRYWLVNPYANRWWAHGRSKAESHLWWTVAAILIILWLPQLLSGYTVGGIIHILLPLALVVVLLRIIQRQRPA